MKMLASFRSLIKIVGGPPLFALSSVGIPTPIQLKAAAPPLQYVLNYC